MTDDKPRRSKKPTETVADDVSDKSEGEPLECFVIMPISDQPNYSSGHFGEIYRDVIKPACMAANVKPRRADENSGTNIIQHEILLDLLNAPLAICDLSSRNPNVMFELGLRQAFDKPVVILQDELTPPIFDISMLRYTTYRSKRMYNEVVEDQVKIKQAILQTLKDSKGGKSANSLIKLLSINKAIFESPTIDDAEKYALRGIQAQMHEISMEVRALRRNHFRRFPDRGMGMADLPLLETEEKLIPLIGDLKIKELDKLVGSTNRKILMSRLFSGDLSRSVFEDIGSESKIEPSMVWREYRRGLVSLESLFGISGEQGEND